LLLLLLLLLFIAAAVRKLSLPNYVDPKRILDVKVGVDNLDSLLALLNV